MIRTKAKAGLITNETLTSASWCPVALHLGSDLQNLGTLPSGICLSCGDVI